MKFLIEQMNYGDEILDYLQSVGDEQTNIEIAMQMLKFFKPRIEDFCDYAGYYEYDYDNDEETEIPLDYYGLVDGIENDYIDCQQLIDALINYFSNSDIGAYFFASGFDDKLYGGMDEEDYDDLELPYTDEERKELENRAKNILSQSKTKHSTISVDKLKKSAEEYLSDNFGYHTGYIKRGFILSDGTYISNNEIINKSNNPAHKHADVIVVKQLANEYDVDEDTIINSLGLGKIYGGGGDDSLAADKFNWIRVNGDFERYILLPKEKITTDQKYALIYWIDEYFSDTNYKYGIKVATSVGTVSKSTKQQTYYPYDYDQSHLMQDGKSIVNKIMKYYQTGNLEEGKDRIAGRLILIE